MLSILIVNWNTREFLKACLESIRRFPYCGETQLIIVENFSTDGSAEMVEQYFPDAEMVRMPRNVGYAAGNNRAMERARGDFLLLLNPDTEVLEGTLDTALAEMTVFPKAGALGARLIGPDGSSQKSIRGFPGFWGIVGDVTGLGSLFPNSVFGRYRLPAFDYEVRSDLNGPAIQPMGTFLLLRRNAVEAVNSAQSRLAPFDEQFPIFFNEVDLLYRMNRAGWPSMYSPDVKVLHHGGASTKQVRKSMIWESHRSLLRFFRKHHMNTWNAPLYPLLAGLVLGSAWIRARGWDAGFRA